jgi:RNA polymerase sigma factor (sigma-70 family)
VTQPSYHASLRQIRQLFNVGTMAGLTDGELLERFTSCNDEAAELAFAALIERHGPMVLRVCQSVLRDRHDAEDAFQATFMILVRKATSIRKHNSVVSWLHGVAFRIASCQRGAEARRRKHERTVAEQPKASTEDESREDVGSVLHEELERLPEKYRAPIVLCYFESLSHERAATQLRWPVGTVRSRLARGREQLHRRLTRRGLAPSIVLLEIALCAESVRAAIPSALATATVHAALHDAPGTILAVGLTSRSVPFLMESAMKVTSFSKIKFTLLASALIASGAIVVGQQPGTMMPAAKAHVASAVVPQNHSGRSGADDDEGAVAREMGQLDLDLLADELRQLRKDVELALREKLHFERTNPGEISEAQNAYRAAHESYLAKARELRAAQRRLGNAKEPREPGPELLASPSTPSDNAVIPGPSTAKSALGHSAAPIGSINLDAVFNRYEKVKKSKKEYSDAVVARQNELMKLMNDANEETQILAKLSPGTVDHKKHENRVTELKARHAAAREQSQREFAQREAEMLAAHYEEIQETVAAMAKAKGLTYVVKVSPELRPDPMPNDVTALLNCSVVYADPRNDLTEEVIRDLNQRFKAAGAKISR